MNKLLKLLQIFASGTAVQYTGMDSNGAYDPTQAGSINVNTGSAVSADAGNLAPEMKTFYDKTLIVLAGANLVHEQFGQKRPIPKHGGKTIEFRKFSKLPKAMKPITEGVTPAGNKLNVSAVTATVNQYGDYVEQTDQLELTSIDNTIVEATKELAEQAGLTLDSVVRDQLIGGFNFMYVPKRSGGSVTTVSSRADIDSTALLTPQDVARAATILANQNAPKINGYYAAIIHPSVAHDLMFSAGEAWKSVMQYAKPDNILKGEIGELYGVRFVQSTEAKILAPAEIADGFNKLTVKTEISSSTSSVVVEEEIESASGLTIECYIGGVANTITAITKGSGQSTLTVGTAISSLAKGATVCGKGAGKDGSNVYLTLFLGANAYGVTEIEGGGLEHVVKQRGYGNDPLNQRSSVGWKAMKTAKILADEYLVRVESGSSFNAAAAN